MFVIPLHTWIPFLCGFYFYLLSQADTQRWSVSLGGGQALDTIPPHDAMPKQSCRDGFFPCFPPLLWDGHTHTLLSFQACWERSICKAVPWPAKRKKEWLQSWYSLVMCWHSAPENEAWGSSKCREMPHCYPSSHGTRACNPVINGILPWGTEGLSDLILVLFWILSLIQAAWRALTEFGGGRTTPQQIFPCHRISVCERGAGEASSEWWQSAPRTAASPLLPDSLTAPKRALNTGWHFDSLSSVTDGYKLQQALKDPGPTKEPQRVCQHDAREPNSRLSASQLLQ